MAVVGDQGVGGLEQEGREYQSDARRMPVRRRYPPLTGAVRRLRDRDPARRVSVGSRLRPLACLRRDEVRVGIACPA